LREDARFIDLAQRVEEEVDQAREQIASLKLARL